MATFTGLSDDIHRMMFHYMSLQDLINLAKTNDLYRAKVFSYINTDRYALSLLPNEVFTYSKISPEHHRKLIRLKIPILLEHITTYEDTILYLLRQPDRGRMLYMLDPEGSIVDYHYRQPSPVRADSGPHAWAKLVSKVAAQTGWAIFEEEATAVYRRSGVQKNGLWYMSYIDEKWQYYLQIPDS